MITIDRSNTIILPLGPWTHITSSPLAAGSNYYVGTYFGGAPPTSNTQGSTGQTYFASLCDGLIYQCQFNFFVGGTVATSSQLALVTIENNTTGLTYGVCNAGPFTSAAGTTFVYSLSVPVVVNKGDRLVGRIIGPAWTGSAPTSLRYMFNPYLTVTV